MVTVKNEVLIEISDLQLTYPVQYFRSQSVRDLFVNAVKAPVSYLTNRKKTNHILKGLSLKVHRGEHVALLGVNGSGKTSLCRCISGVLHPSAGTIKKSCEVRAVIQTESGFYPELTGRENAWLISEFLYPKLSRIERQHVVDEALEFSELGNYRDVALENYSLGMKSRLSLSLITARSAELLILDEVSSHADEFFRKKVDGRLKRQIDAAHAVIVVSHYESDLIATCKRGILLEQGRIAFDGPLEQAFKAYRFFHGEKHV